jgi:hypothetical protein
VGCTKTGGRPLFSFSCTDLVAIGNLSSLKRKTKKKNLRYATITLNLIKLLGSDLHS